MSQPTSNEPPTASDVFGGRGADLFTWRQTTPSTPRAPSIEEAHSMSDASSRSTASDSVAPGTVLRVEKVGPRVRVFHIARPSDLSFTAGQYLKLGLASLKSHKYSIASAPEDEQLSFCIALVQGGRLTPGLFSLQPGSRLEIASKAGGRFALDPSARTHVMVATTTGVAPFRSMIRSALARRSRDRFVLVHAASYLEDLPYFAELKQLGERSPQLTYIPTLSRTPGAHNRPWSGRQGRADVVTPGLLQEELRRDPNLQVYACGRAEMIEALRKRLTRDVRSESFG